MNQDYWQKQSDEPLFPNILWSRPETKQGAGKLLIIGGQAQEFIHVAECYAAAEKAGAGTIRVLMPESTRKITKMLPNIEYAPSNQSGSFARGALSELLEASLWADGVLLAGDLGKNSETSLMLENFIAKYNKLLIVSAEALPSLPMRTGDLFKRDSTLLILNISDLQKAAIDLQLQTPITSSISNVNLAAALHDITSRLPATLLIKDKSRIWTSAHGRVVSTESAEKSTSTLAATVSVWAIQNPSKIFEAAATALLQ